MENWVWDADSVHTLFSEQLVEVFFLNIFYILIFFFRKSDLTSDSIHAALLLLLFISSAIKL